MRWLIVLLAAGLAGPAVPLGQAHAQTPPTRVFGSVTIDGRPAPLGTAVQALIRDKVCGEGVVRRVSDEIPQGYVVDVVGVTQVQGCGSDGDTITFQVGGVKANETGEFRTGTFLRLNLTVSGQVATPTPGPTPPPFGSPTAPPAGGAATAAPGGGAGTPTPGANQGSPSAATPATGSTATASPAVRFTATAVGPQRADRDDGGGGATVIWVVLIIAALGGAGAAGYLMYRRGRG